MMSITRNSFKRPAALIAAVALTISIGASAYLAQVAYAVTATQVTSRSVQLSDSAPSGGTITTGVGSGTAVEYAVQFTTAASTHNIGIVVVDICASSPLFGDTTCTLPAGFNWGAATPTLKGGSLSGLSGFTTGSIQGAGAGAATPQLVTLSNATPQSVNASTVIKFTIQGVVNPTSTGTFYARILTFDTAAHVSEYGVSGTTRAGSGAMTDAYDYGGVAMSTTAPIVVTARVMESLLLCTSAAAYSGLACAGATPPAIVIGHGSPTSYIDTSAVDTASVYTQISTNASGGYAVYLRGSNTCGGLSRDGGTTCGIPAVNAGSSTAIAIAAGTAAFGAKFTAGTAHAGGTGTNTAVARWNGTSGFYMMDTTTATDNVTYVYGSKVIDAAASQANSVENTITLAATASATTPAGIYTENFALIGVGTF